MHFILRVPVHLNSLRRPVLDVTRTVNHLVVMSFNICSKHDYGGVKVVLRFWVRVERMFNRFALMLVESEKWEQGGDKKWEQGGDKSESYIKREMNSESYRIISDEK